MSLNGQEDIQLKNIIAQLENVFELTKHSYAEEGKILRGQKKKFHDILQKKVVEMAGLFGFEGYKELLIKNYESDRNGYIDVVWKANRLNKVLIEIDSSPRVRSVKKLLKGSGEYKIWLYYGEKSPIESLQLDRRREIILLRGSID